MKRYALEVNILPASAYSTLICITVQHNLRHWISLC